MVDYTQGPSASAGAGHGAILRLSKHFNNPIDLLKDTPLKHTNGKLWISNVKTNFDINKIKIDDS